MDEVLSKLDNLARLCKASVAVTYNEHTTNYESVEDYLRHGESNRLFERPDDADKMIAENRIVEVHFYTRTPVGFYHVIGADLEPLLDEALDIAEKELTS